MEKRSEFIPLGGMNQDDSVISPTHNAAGESLFTNGDYRYALNARIGSSHSNNFGDVENILGTLEVSAYNTYGSLVTNPEFLNIVGLFGWDQLADGVNAGAWVGIGDSARATASTNDASVRSPTIYQNIEPSIKRINIRLDYSLVKFTAGVSFFVSFMAGTDVLSSKQISGPDDEEINVSLVIPNECTGVGVYFTSTSDNTTSSLSLQYLRINGFEQSGSRPAGTNKTRGYYIDKEHLRVYFCNWNSNGDHTINFYDHTTKGVFELLKWDGLDFQENGFVDMAMLDNWLAITDRNSNPRLIDVDSISELHRVLGDDFREFHISFHKWAPTIPPVPYVLYTGGVNNFERLKNKIYQFAFRILYKGNLKSRFSPISKGAITTKCGNYYSTGDALTTDKITYISVRIPIVILDNPGADTEYNYFDHNDDKFIEAVDGIELAYREGELELWKTWKTVKTKDVVEYYFFDGNADQTPIPNSDFDQPFDAVPFLAGTVEAIDNRFVFGDCLDELDPVRTIEVTNAGSVTDPTEDWNDSAPNSFPLIASGPRERLLRLNSLSDFTFKQRGTYKVGIVFIHHTGWKSAVYPFETTFEVNDVSRYRMTAFTFLFGDSFVPPDWAVAFEIVRTNCLNIDAFMFGIVNAFIPLIDDPEALLDDVKGMPDHVKARLTEHFENAKTINGYDIAEQTAKVVTEEEIRAARFNTNSFVQDKLGKRLPTSYIKDEDYNVSKNGILRHLQLNSLKEKITPEIRKTIEGILFENASRICIDIGNWYNASKASTTKDNPLNKLFYNYRPGDRVRFVGSDVASPSSQDYKTYDVPILEFSGRTLIIEKPSTLKFTAGRGSGSMSSNLHVIEVYTPKTPTQEDFIFYGTGEVYPILYPGTSNRTFAKKDWRYTSNNSVTVTSYGHFDIFHKMPFFYGDSMYISKTMYRTSVAPNGGGNSAGVGTSMNPDPDKIYDYWERNNGRATIAYIDLPVPKFKLTQLKFGGKIIEESNVNAITRFQSQDQFVYPSEYGRIRKIINTSNAQVESAGSILLAIGERETWSIYVNRTTLNDLSGRQQVIMSDKVLGSYNTLLGGHGTMNPESVSIERGNVYFWDVLDGSWIRYGRDGLTPISQYKMRNWFREIGKLIESEYFSSDTPPRAISSFDSFNDELVTYIDHSSMPETFRGYDSYKGALFSETDKRWKSIHTWNPELFSRIGTQLISFKDGRVYLHEQGTAQSTFYETKEDVYLEPVFNTDPRDNKVWKTLAVCANDKWSATRIMSEYRGQKALIQSELSLDNFDEREDTYWAAILRDSNSLGVTNPTIEGRPVICKAIQVLLKLDPSVVTLSLLHYVNAGYIDSPKNP